MSFSLAAKVEAILYLKARPLKVAEIVEYAQTERDQVEDALIQLMEDYAHRDSALEITESSEGYTLQLRSGFQELVKVLVPVDLGVAALRTLAAIALKNGITQSDLVDLRGSGAYQHVQELVALGFVRKLRHKDSRSYRLTITEKFHQYFQIQELPQILQMAAAAPAPDPEVAIEPPPP